MGWNLPYLPIPWSCRIVGCVWQGKRQNDLDPQTGGSWTQTNSNSFVFVSPLPCSWLDDVDLKFGRVNRSSKKLKDIEEMSIATVSLSGMFTKLDSLSSSCSWRSFFYLLLFWPCRGKKPGLRPVLAASGSQANGQIHLGYHDVFSH